MEAKTDEHCKCNRATNEEGSASQTSSRTLLGEVSGSLWRWCEAALGIYAFFGGGVGDERRNGRMKRREEEEEVEVIHSDPAATIKIGGVRCLHSSLCKEPPAGAVFFFLLHLSLSVALGFFQISLIFF